MVATTQQQQQQQQQLLLGPPSQLLLPFDAHNHIQLGPPPLPLPLPATLPSSPPISPPFYDGDFGGERDTPPSSSLLVKSLGEYIRHELRGKHLSGMALMATHPRDFPVLLDLERELQKPDAVDADEETETENETENENETMMRIVPCLGVHPWFLHELDPKHDWEMVPSPLCVPPSPSPTTTTTAPPPPPPPLEQEADPGKVPRWIANIESLLVEHPHLPVGEIGLDGFHFCPSTGELTTPMDRQVEALTLQLRVATSLHRPVSLHCVRATGKLTEALERVAEENLERLSDEWNNGGGGGGGVSPDSGTDSDDNGNGNDSGNDNRLRILPPKIYFHAFGGKAATATQLIKTLEKPRRIKILQKENGNGNATNGTNNKKKQKQKQKQQKFVRVVPPRVYFGFAPPVNFQSPKTASVIRAVGLDRLVLETDREDARLIGDDMKAGTTWISEVLEITTEELVSATNENSRDLYGY